MYWFSNVGVHRIPAGLIKTQITGPHSRVSDSVGLEWGLKICISNKFSGHGDVT